MPVITIDWYEGRSDDVKRELAEKLTDLMVDVGQARRDSVWIRFVDSPKKDWAIGGVKND
jgi:4-oxalocrotonate tautomerase family enzyme